MIRRCRSGVASSARSWAAFPKKTPPCLNEFGWQLMTVPYRLQNGCGYKFVQMWVRYLFSDKLERAPAANEGPRWSRVLPNLPQHTPELYPFFNTPVCRVSIHQCIVEIYIPRISHQQIPYAPTFQLLFPISPGKLILLYTTFEEYLDAFFPSRTTPLLLYLD